jgi:hypothetical protein
LIAATGVAVLLDDLGGAVLARQALARVAAAHGDDPLGAELLGSKHGEQPDRSVAHDGDRLAGAGFGGHGAEPAGAEDVGRCEQARDEIVGGDVRGGDERAVGERDAQKVGLGAEGAHGYAVDAGALVAGPADRAGVVGAPEGTDHELARLDRLNLRADLLDDAGVLVAHRCRPRELLDPSVGSQVRAAHAGGGDADDCVRRFDDPRRLALFDSHIARAVHHCSTHNCLLEFVICIGRGAGQAATRASSWARLVDSSRCASPGRAGVGLSARRRCPRC